MNVTDEQIQNIALERLPTFHGRRNESFDAWSFQVGQYFNLTDILRNQQVEVASTYFRDAAATWYRSMYQQWEIQDEGPTWAEFIKATQK